MSSQEISRRSFLKLGQYVTLTSVLAFNFGCSINPAVKDKSKRVALVYATRYGATRDTASWIAKGIEREVDLLNIEDMSFEQTAKEYELIILGSGIWIDGVHKDLLKFIKTQKKHLEDKLVATFIVCGTTKNDSKGRARIEQYFNKFHASLNVKPPFQEQFGGRLSIDELNEKDAKLLENFYKKVLKKEFVSWDRTQPKEALSFAKSLKLNKKLLT